MLDVERYLVDIMPGQVDASSEFEYMKAQAVALRRKIYYSMGEERVIKIEDLEFPYYTIDDYIAKWGEDRYQKVREKYQRAVYETRGIVQ